MKYAVRNEEGGRIRRAFALAFGAGAVAFVLAACASGPMASGELARVTPPGAPAHVAPGGAPAHDARAASLAAPPSLALARFDPSAEGVENVPLEGTSTPMAKLLQRSVVAAFGRYNVPAIASPSGGRYRLSGHAAPNRDLAQPSVVAIEWEIFDRRQGRETGRFMLPVVGDHFAWDNGDPRVIAQVGEETSRRFVELVDGARARAVSHGPGDMPAFADLSSPAPRDRPEAGPRTGSAGFVEAGVSAGVSVDASAPASRAKPASGTSTARPRVFAEPASAGMSAEASSGAKAGNAPVFLARVGGAPGDGDAALARAARAAFVVGGLATAARREDARYIVAGSVNVGASAQGRQPVRIVWEVSAPDGRPLGRAVQENAVPEGTLNGSWGPMASLVAGAAVKGIADVIRRAEDTASRAAPSESAERRLKIPPAASAGAPAMPPPAGASAKAGEARPPG